MRHWLYILLLTFCTKAAIANTTKEDLDKIEHIMYQMDDLDSAFTYTKEILTKFEKNNNTFGIVRANLYLGYIQELQGEYGKSVLYYLEGIRIADDSEDEKVKPNRVWLRRNLANIFRWFDAHELATKYNFEAIDIATELGRDKLARGIKHNQALVYHNNKEYQNAITLFEEILPQIEDKVYESEIINLVGLSYYENGDPTNASNYFNSLLSVSNESLLYKAKALHNLGEIQYDEGNIEGAIQHLRDAIVIMESNDLGDQYSLFLSYRNIGHYLFEKDEVDESQLFLNKGEALMSYAEWNSSSFNLYKTFSSLYYKIGNRELGAKYGNLYFDKIQEFIETQEELQKKDRKYNFDLITQRYFDQVRKEERIANILLYSKITSGTLLALLLLVVGYNRYEKSKLRKSIEQELISLRVIE